jgi:rhomboid protease GluP
MSPDQQRDDDWIEATVRLAGRLGLDSVRLRWRLMRWQRAWRDWHRRKRSQIDHAGYQHKVCPQCGQVQDRHERRCVQCGAPLGARVWQVANRLGLVVPSAISVSTLLGMIIAVAYLRLMLSRPGTGYLAVGSDDLIYRGAYYLPALQAGQLWRHATAIFLHIGLLHLGFNLVALAQIGPAVEETFGRSRMLLLFIATGATGFAACQVLGMRAVSAGASGAIMGLCGAAAGWGQRDGTTAGKAVRNHMLKWAAYTMIFGLLIRANNVAHAAGFCAGAVLGFFMPPRWLRRGFARGSDVAIGFASVAALIVAFALVLRPPASSESWARAHAAQARMYREAGATARQGERPRE